MGALYLTYRGQVGLDFENEPEVTIFTIREARGLLPKLRKLVGRMMDERTALMQIGAEVDRARRNAHYGGGSPLGPKYLRHLISFSEQVQKVEQLGVVIKDFETGLVDFPHKRGGRIVYLCWKIDEDDIGWWHEIEAGFAGRQPIKEE